MQNECMSQGPVVAVEAGMSMLQCLMDQDQSDEALGKQKRLKLNQVAALENCSSCVLFKAQTSKKVWACRRDRLLERICEQLAGLSCKARRKTIEQCFTETQRLALEQWMVRCYTKDRSHKISSTMPMCGSAFTIRAAVLKSPHSSRCMPLAVPPTSKSADELQRAQIHQASHQDPKHIRCTRLHPPGLVCQVSLATGSSSYYALACVGMIRLTTRKCSDRPLAMQHSIALAAICRRAAAAAGTLDQSLKHAIADGISKESLASLGLRLSVRLCVHRWAGTLATRCFKTFDEEDFEQGLKAWRRLYDARQAMLAAGGASSVYRGPPTVEEHVAWTRLRETFLDIEEEAGLPRSVRAARLDQAEKTKLAHRDALSEMWNRKRMAQEEHAQRREVCKKPRLYKCWQTQQVVQLLSSLTHIEKHLQHASDAFVVKVRGFNGGRHDRHGDYHTFLKMSTARGRKIKRYNHLRKDKSRSKSKRRQL